MKERIRMARLEVNASRPERPTLRQPDPCDEEDALK
jgi:hypothetical protein